MSGMSFHRFRQIKKFMCFNVVREADIATDGPRKGRTIDKLHRVRPLIKLLQDTFEALVIPGLLWSIDEGMVPYRGRFCPCKVYMKDKPHKFGIKIWMLCCAVTGFCYMFKVYEGRGDLFPGETPEFVDLWGLGERVVLFFANLVRKGSHLFTDRFFTTPAVCVELRRRGIWITGTAMKNKQGIDKQTQFKKSKNVQRFFFSWVYDKALRICQLCWLDRMPVLLLTNIFGPLRGEGVRRLTVDLAGKFERLLSGWS